MNTRTEVFLDWLARRLYEQWWTPDSVHYWAHRRIVPVDL